MNRANTGANTNVGLIVTDILTLASAFMISMLLWNKALHVDLLLKLFALAAIFILVFLLSCKSSYLYNVTLFYYLDRVYKKVTKSFIMSVLVTALIKNYIMEPSEGMRFYISFLVIAYLFICLKIYFYRFFSKGLHVFGQPRTAFVGRADSFEKFFYFLGKTSIHFEYVGCISKSRNDDNGDYIGCLEDLEDLIRKYKLDQIYFIQQEAVEQYIIQQYIDLCVDMGVTIRLIMDFYEPRCVNSYVSSVGTYPVITYHTITLNAYEQVVKRIVDILAGIIGLVLFSPIMLLTAVAIKADSPGPVIFRQRRVGQNGREFNIYKFRSMYMDAEERKAELMKRNEIQGENAGCMFKMKDDPRVTKVGKFIRKYSIDELPQFFNILKGDMSLVGTRPPTIDEVTKYGRSQWRRISIRPGLTGMWQVNGRSEISSFEEVVRMDISYIDNWSLFLDFKIMFKTISVLFNHSGAY